MALAECRALGAVIRRTSPTTHDNEIGSRAFDFYDHWTEADSRLEPHQAQLSPCCATLGYDLNNIACYVSQILWWLAPEQIYDGRGVVVVGAMTEAVLVSVRCGGDALAGQLGYVASTKPGQAPRSSLSDLITWANRNPTRVRREVALVFERDWGWFERAKSLRDQIVHGAAHANIATDRRQFFLWLHSDKVGWIAREPLLPFLRDLIVGLLAAAEDVGTAVGTCTGLPDDRANSRILHGVMIPAINDLVRVADMYAAPSP